MKKITNKQEPVQVVCVCVCSKLDFVKKTKEVSDMGMFGADFWAESAPGRAEEAFKKLPGGGTLHSDRIWAFGSHRDTVHYHLYRFRGHY